LTAELIPIIHGPGPEILSYIKENALIPLLYTATSCIIEITCAKLMWRKLYVEIAYINLISSPIAWLFTIIITLPSTYMVALKILVNYFSWELASIIYAIAYITSLTVMSSLLEISLLKKRGIKYLKSSIIVLNTISTVALIAALAYL